METHGNGDNPPPEGDRPPEEPADAPDLPALPEGVVIPDDVSALEPDVDKIQAELAGAPPAEPGPPEPASPREPSPAMPLVIMAVAIAITLVSLFAMAWSGTGTPDRAGNSAPSLPDEVALTDDTGQPRSVGAQAPAAVLLIERCGDCTELIADTAAAAPAGVSVVVVGDSAPRYPPDLPAAAANLVLLADPDGELRSALTLGPPPAGAATVVLADRDEIVRTTPSTNSIEPYQDALATLGG